MPFGSVNFEFVCAKCFSDEALREFISGIATSKKCDFCGRTSSKKIAAPFEAVSERSLSALLVIMTIRATPA